MDDEKPRVDFGQTGTPPNITTNVYNNKRSHWQAFACYLITLAAVAFTFKDAADNGKNSYASKAITTVKDALRNPPEKPKTKFVNTGMTASQLKKVLAEQFKADSLLQVARDSSLNSTLDSLKEQGKNHLFIMPFPSDTTNNEAGSDTAAAQKPKVMYQM